MCAFVVTGFFGHWSKSPLANTTTAMPPGNRKPDSSWDPSWASSVISIFKTTWRCWGSTTACRWPDLYDQYVYRQTQVRFVLTLWLVNNTGTNFSKCNLCSVGLYSKRADHIKCCSCIRKHLIWFIGWRSSRAAVQYNIVVFLQWFAACVYDTCICRIDKFSTVTNAIKNMKNCGWFETTRTVRRYSKIIQKSCSIICCDKTVSRTRKSIGCKKSNKHWTYVSNNYVKLRARPMRVHHYNILSILFITDSAYVNIRRGLFPIYRILIYFMRRENSR